MAIFGEEFAPQAAGGGGAGGGDSIRSVSMSANVPMSILQSKI